MSADLEVLRTSVGKLRELVSSLSPDDLEVPAYPSAWTVADVLSHLGSAAVIFGLRIDQGLGGPPVVSQPIWDEWNAKSPADKVMDGLHADQAYLDRIDDLTEEQRARLKVPLGRLTFDFASFLRLRINEHVLHSWDIRVAFEPTATLLPEGVPVVLDAAPMIAGYSGQASQLQREVLVRTTNPDRSFMVIITEDGVKVEWDADGVADLVMPAEAFIRLVYGRLDPDHTPAYEGEHADLDLLRLALPGI